MKRLLIVSVAALLLTACREKTKPIEYEVDWGPTIAAEIAAQETARAGR